MITSFAVTEKGEPMARYIDANKIVDTVCVGISCHECSFGFNEDGVSECVLGKRIDDLPTADVRENVRGFWYALEKGDKGYSAGDFKCSICGEPNHTWLPKPNFCPNCGAAMKGGQA